MFALHNNIVNFPFLRYPKILETQRIPDCTDLSAALSFLFYTPIRVIFNNL